MTVRKKLSKSKIDETSEFPVYSAESSNNGIVGYVNNPEFICDEKNPVYVNFGDHTRNFNIATKSFSVLDNVKVLLPKINNIRVLQFIISSWKKQIKNLGYSRHWKLAQDCLILLPTKDGEIDFKFMEEFIAELEAERIAELEAYLTAAGLKDTILTAEEEIALKSFSTRRFEKFLLKDLFEMANTKSIVKEKIIPDSGKIPYVTASAENNGIMTYINCPAEWIDKGNCIMIGGKTLTFTYQEKNFCSNDSHNIVLYAKEKNLSKKIIYLFFMSAMRASMKNKYSWGNSISMKKIQEDFLYLPTKDGEPDYEFMKNFITAVQKIVIADVVKYSEEKISAYRQAAMINS